MRKLKPVTPGELLMEEFLRPLGISQYRLAKEIGVPAQRIGQIVKGKRVVTAETDWRLCRFFGLSNGYWLRARAAHDTEIAERALGKKNPQNQAVGGMSFGFCSRTRPGPVIGDLLLTDSRPSDPVLSLQTG